MSGEKQEKMAKVFRKIMEDKAAIKAYIREHGTLKGFNDATIQFAKPL